MSDGAEVNLHWFANGNAEPRIVRFDGERYFLSWPREAPPGQVHRELLELQIGAGITPEALLAIVATHLRVQQVRKFSRRREHAINLTVAALQKLNEAALSQYDVTDEGD